MAKSETASVLRVKPDEKPSKPEKAKTTNKLKAKGVPTAKAKELSGEDDDNLTAREIAERRIAWQRQLKKA